MVFNGEGNGMAASLHVDGQRSRLGSELVLHWNRVWDLSRALVYLFTVPVTEGESLYRSMALRCRTVLACWQFLVDVG